MSNIKTLQMPNLLKCMVKLAIQILIALSMAYITTIFFNVWPAYHFVIEMKSNRQGVAQLFWNNGMGFHGLDSEFAAIKQTETFFSYRFPLPYGRYFGFRFDPNDRDGTYVLQDARIVDKHNATIQVFPIEDFKGINQIDELVVTEHQLSVKTTDGCNDPIIVVDLAHPVVLYKSTTTLIASFLILFVFYLSLLLLYFKSSLFNPNALLKYLTSVSTYLAGHPKKGILITGILAALLSCYPIVFFGRSFVSPNNGGAGMLYDRAPFLFGSSDEIVENVRGSDVGAMMWQWLPYSVVQHQSIFGYGEFPFWSRYNSGGLSLVGQGQSMIGDPLHWIPVIFGGASWAWDTKFLTAKALFCAGTGLMVWVCTQSLGAALVLTVSSAFMGFFAYRLNHGAFFGLCYAPWVLLSWFLLSRSKDIIQTLGSLFVNIVASWMVLNSGTAKEAFILLLFMNLTGFAALMSSNIDSKKKWFLCLISLIQAVAFVLISAPYWIQFLFTFSYSSHSYSVPRADQLSLWKFAGFFDNIFYGQVEAGFVGWPSTNFLIAGGIVWAVVRARHLRTKIFFLPLLWMSMLSIGLIYGLVPESIVIKIPFLNSIHHIHNTFSCVLIIQALAVSGFGISQFISDIASSRWGFFYKIYVIIILLSLMTFYIGCSHNVPGSLHRINFIAVGIISTVGAILCPPIFRSLIQPQKPKNALVFLAFCAVGVMLFRHGMHIESWDRTWDNLVVNPRQRVEANVKPIILNMTGATPTEAERTVGVDGLLMPGYNSAIAVESINSPDALFNSFYRQLMEALGFKYNEFGWCILLRSVDIYLLLPALRFLNVGYILAPLDALKLGSDIAKIGNSGFDLLKIRAPWPRAFYCSNPRFYSDIHHLAAMVREADTKPFIALEEGTLARTRDNLSLSENCGFVGATNYMFTPNSTTFRIVAPGAGYVALLESFAPDECKVSVNGLSVERFRVNHAFQGIYLNEGGVYDITFTYRPKYWTISLMLALSGLTIVILLYLGLIFYKTIASLGPKSLSY